MAPVALCTTDFPSGRALRLGLFIAASITLHAAIIGGVRLAPFSGIIGGEAPAYPPLEVTIGGEIAQASTDENPQVQAARAVAVARPGGEGAPQRRSNASSAGAIEVPAAIKWFTAEELDVRAEPLLLREFEYPQGLRGTKIFGKVRLRLFIDEHGFLRKLEIVASEPPGVFDTAAEAAWSSVRFSPARKDGAPVKSQKLIEIAFAPD